MYVFKIKQGYDEVRFEFEALDDIAVVLQLFDGNEQADTKYSISKSVKAKGENQDEE